MNGVEPSCFEKMAADLEASGRYRVLTKIGIPQPSYPMESGDLLGIFLDLETTGLDQKRDEIIEISMIPFFYSASGVITGYGNFFSQVRQPSSPITPEVTALTGITNDMVAGLTIDPTEIDNFVAPANLIVAHNASFDRPFAETFCESFKNKAWTCSMSDIDWKAEGAESTKLAYLGMMAGFFYDGHRALNDCAAGLELLTRPLPRSGVPGMTQLLISARSPTWRIWAVNAPFGRKDVLKARGYHWNDGENGKSRSWFIDVREDKRDEEMQFLQREIYPIGNAARAVRVTAIDRFSNRC